MTLFLDEVVVDVGSGAGGRGAVSFRREKYVPQGGPDGGDGGRGGDVVLHADPGLTTLGGFRDRRKFSARNGTPGAAALCSGANADDLVLEVPPGTVVTDLDTGELLVDLDHPGVSLVVCRGGRGGRGNARFASAVRQAPRVGELGEQGTRRRLKLELKLIADVGLVGLPNAGKSTLLAALTGAHPKIAAYPFTTLSPNLGVAEAEGGHPYVIADVPGLIEGAHHGVGLGHDFLRHLERTRVLIHVVDCSVDLDLARSSIGQIVGELGRFGAELAAKPRILALNKIDAPGAAALAIELARDHPGAHRISAATGEGCAALLLAAIEAAKAARADALASAPPVPKPGEHRIYTFRGRSVAAPVITRDGVAYRVSSERVERWVSMTDLDNDEAVAHLQRRMRAAGVDQALAAAGCVPGDTVRIGAAEFEWQDG